MMVPIGVDNIHKVLLGLWNIYKDNSSAWNYLRNGVDCCDQTFDKLKHDCTNCGTHWLAQLINVSYLQLDIWFDSRKALQFFKDSCREETKERCILYFVKKEEWHETSLNEIYILERIFEKCHYNIEETASMIHKSPKIVSYCIRNKKLPPKTKSLFSIGKYFEWIIVLKLDLRTFLPNVPLPFFAHEDEERVSEGPMVRFTNGDQEEAFFNQSVFWDEIGNLGKSSCVMGEFDKERFIRACISFVKRSHP